MIVDDTRLFESKDNNNKKYNNTSTGNIREEDLETTYTRFF